ncbi:MAG: DUF58 domain-containing protein [Actinobacteria bacterium]|nr:DUF58 domain-containing protein [Actinomycetota bacterium]
MRLSLGDRGRGVAIATAVCLILGWLLRSPPVLALGLAGVVALAVALVWVAVQPTVEAERDLEPKRVSVGEPSHAVVTIANWGRLRSPALALDDPVGDQVARGTLPPLSRGQEDTSTYPLPTSRRGVFAVGPLRLGRTDPLQLLKRSRRYGRVETLCVHPRVHPINARPAGRHRDLEGATRESAPEGGITFHAIREYEIGDDLRHVHWRATAHTGSLMVRQFVDTSQPNTMVILDNRASIHTADSFELAAEVAASIVSASLSQNFPIELKLLDQPGLGGTRSVAHDVFLEALAAANLGRQGDLLGVLRTMPTATEGNTLVIVTAAPGAREEMPAIARLATSFDSVLVVNVRAADGTLPAPSALVQVLDVDTAENFVRLWQSGNRA